MTGISAPLPVSRSAYRLPGRKLLVTLRDAAIIKLRKTERVSPKGNLPLKALLERL
jgi:hypothetical protein